MIRILLAGLILIASPAFAIEGMTSKAATDAVMQSPWKEVGLPGGKGRVMAFISFSCQFCMQTDEKFTSWATTLPKGIGFEQVPLIYTKSDIQLAIAFYSVFYTEPEKLGVFKQELYHLGTMMGQNQAIDNAALLSLAERTGLNVSVFAQATQTRTVKDAVARAIEITQKIGFDVTPSIIVGGKYLTHAGYTSGNYDALIQLLNGLVSREIGGFR